MIRYSLITKKMQREFVLLQGNGCSWRRCTFCDYYTDMSNNPFLVNKKVLANVTGQFGVLDIINSGSCIELDEATVNLIAELVQEKPIHTLWFEAHWMYRYKLNDFAARFPGVAVKFRTGIETFDTHMRSRWNKGIPNSITVSNITRYFQGVCLLVGVVGQTREAISRDIEIAMACFEYISVNVFVENTTKEKRDNALVDWFIQEWGEKLRLSPKADILLYNTDLGVG